MLQTESTSPPRAHRLRLFPAWNWVVIKPPRTQVLVFGDMPLKGDCGHSTSQLPLRERPPGLTLPPRRAFPRPQIIQVNQP